MKTRVKKAIRGLDNHTIVDIVKVGQFSGYPVFSGYLMEIAIEEPELLSLEVANTTLEHAHNNQYLTIEIY